MRELRLFNVHHDCTTLSPVRSTAFYAEGCNFRCKGCLYWEGHDHLGVFTMTAEEAAKSVIDHESECVVLSGGNPLLQAGAFLEMVEVLKSSVDIGVIIYCGETAEELEGLKAVNEDVRRLLAHADVVISGRYMPEFDIGNAMVGSTNQVVEFVTGRYEEYGWMYEDADRTIEIELSDRDDRPHISYSGVPTAVQRRFFDELVKAVVGGAEPGDTGAVSTYSLSDGAYMFVSDGFTLAHSVTGDDGIRLMLKPIGDSDVVPLVNAFLRIGGGSCGD